MVEPQNGQDAAWLEAVFQRFESRLVGYAARLVGDVERGRDVVQDVFLRLCREGPERTSDHIAAWLYTACRNRALDVSKKEQRMGSLPPSVAVSAEDRAANPAETAEQREDAGRATALIDLLPLRQQEILRLKIEHGLKYREISEITGLSVSNVGYLLHQSLKTLRRECIQTHSE